MDFDLESLVDIEKTFYDTGYEDGFAHGRIHGLIEGRALGRGRGFEMWEELGYYEGFALMWKSIYAKSSRNDDRAIHHIRHLLELISRFPMVNPSALDLASDMDIPRLFRQIRSRYKALCSTLGIRPTLRYSEKSQERDDNTDPIAVGEGSRIKRNSVWKLDKSTPSGQTLNF